MIRISGRERRRVARGQLRGTAGPRGLGPAGDLLGKLRREMPEGRRRRVRRAPPSAWPKRSAPVTAAAVDPVSGVAAAPPPAPRTPAPVEHLSFPQPETHPSLYRNGTCAAASNRCSRDTGATSSPSAWPSSTSPARQPGTATAGGRGGAHRRRRGAARQRAPRRRAIQARGGRALCAGAQPGHRRGRADRRAAAADPERAEGRRWTSDRGLGGRRRLPRARDRRRRASPQRRRSDVAGALGRTTGRRRPPGPLSSRSACKIDHRLGKFAHNLRKPGDPVENSGRRRTTAPRPNQIDDP